MSIEDFIRLREQIERNITKISDILRSRYPDIPYIYDIYDESEKLWEELVTLVCNDTQERVKNRLELDLKSVRFKLSGKKLSHREEYGIDNIGLDSEEALSRVKQIIKDKTFSNNHHNVYVIELYPQVMNEWKFRERNQQYDSKQLCLYIGMTGLTPEERFENHKAGYKSNKYVKKYGKYLRPSFYDTFNPMSYEDALFVEKWLAFQLAKQGFAVWQG
jgi:hypothetical protein